MQYSYLLTSQLESQRIYWENKIVRIEKDTAEEVSSELFISEKSEWRREVWAWVFFFGGGGILCETLLPLPLDTLSGRKRSCLCKPFSFLEEEEAKACRGAAFALCVPKTMWR